MLLERRKFLRASLLFGASAVLFYGNAPSAFARTLFDDGRLSDEVLRDPLYSFTRETFEPYVGGYFEAVGAREKIALKLIKVDSYDPNPLTKMSTRTPAETESFSLQFKSEAPLPSFTSIHQIQHGALGDFNLFLTRRDGQNGEIFYEAVFNRLR